MDKIGSESRAIRVGLNTFLSSNGWSGLNFSEGWSEIDIENPLVNVYIIDAGKENLELGRQASSHALYNRVAQIDVYMESESRVRDVCGDIMEYLDATSFDIKDLMTTSGIGYLSFPDSSTISSVTIPPTFNNPEILRWRGSVRGDFEAYYPSGGNPI